MNETFFASKRTFFILSAVCICIFIILNLQAAAPLIRTLDGVDKSLMVALNHDGGPCADRFWDTISSNISWVPVGAALVFSLAYYKRSLLIPLFFIVGLALTITLADQIASSFLKPYFCRLRPSRNEEICGILHFVDGYRGGKYGFVSSHAANAFGVLAFLAPVIKHKATIVVLFVWSCLVVYSRIYLGVHYPGDILAGALLGVTVGTGVSIAMRWAYAKTVNLKVKLAETKDLKLGIESGIIMLTIVSTGLYMLFYNFSQAAPLPYTASGFVSMLN